MFNFKEIMKAKLVKTENGYGLEDVEIIAFYSSKRPEHKHYKLSKQNCDEIFGVIDVELMADFYGASVKGSLDFKFGANKGFEDGFNKAMELNKDKVFTKEDMIWARDSGYTNFMTEEMFFDKLDMHNQQPTEIEVEIESKIALDGHAILGYELDSDGCLILKT